MKLIAYQFWITINGSMKISGMTKCSGLYEMSTLNLLPLLGRNDMECMITGCSNYLEEETVFCKPVLPNMVMEITFIYGGSKLVFRIKRKYY